MTAAPIAFVTGASRGIGRAGAIALARAGFDVVITARTMREGEGRSAPVAVADEAAPIAIPGSLETTAAEIEAIGRRALPVRMDLMQRASVERAFDTAVAAWGQVDLLFNNAIYQGPGPMDRLLDLTVEHAQAILTGDYLHQLVLIRRALPGMIERRRGWVINMTSGSAILTPPAPAGKGGWGAGYAAAKAAFTRVAPILMVEHGDDGIFACSVDPGFVITEGMKARAGAATYEQAGFRGAPPEVIGAVIGWLATSPEAARYGGETVFAQKVCKELGLVPGWPPPRPR